MPPADLRPVPVSMGAREARAQDYGPFRLTVARFGGEVVLGRHTHDRVTFAVMLEGGFDLLIAGRRLPCPAGTVFTEPAGDTHANHVGAQGARVMVVQPDPAADFPAPCRRLLGGVSHFTNPAARSLARRLADELRAPDDLTPLEAQALTFELLALASATADTRDRKPPGWLVRASDRLTDEFRSSVTVEALAREANVHPSHFTREFRRWYGMSPGAYMRRQRIEWATRLLRTTDEPLSAIALAAGFADQAHFTRAFRRHWGVPPGRYRAQRSSRPATSP